MAGIQVLPYVPSFGERLTPILNDALANIGQGVGRMQRNKSDQAVLSSIQSGNLSDIGLASAWDKLSPEARKTYEPFLSSQLRTQENETKLKQKEESAKRTAEAEKASTREELIPASKALDQLIDKAAYGAGGIGASAELDASGFWYTDKVYTHFNKGVVSNVRFKNMKDDLAPNASQPPSVNRARLAALNRMAGLPADISSDKFDKVLEKEIKDVKKVEDQAAKVDEKKKGKSSALTDERAAEIFAEAGQDPAKAREIAKKRGYEF